MTPAQNLLRQSIEMGHFVVRAYVADLTDAELMIRSVPGANHAAWQLGHMIGATCGMMKAIGRTPPALPPDFDTAYKAEAASSDDPGRFATKAEVLALMDEVKTASLAAVEATPDSQLDAPGPESMRDYAPTVGSVLMLLGTHWLMHAGQLVPIRRKLGKPPLF
jgi:hypothetical protein